MKTMTAGIIALMAGAPIATATDTYTDVNDFLNNVVPGFYDEDFSSVPTGAQTTLNFSSNGFAYTAASTVGMDAGSTATAASSTTRASSRSTPPPTRC